METLPESEEERARSGDAHGKQLSALPLRFRSPALEEKDAASPESYRMNSPQETRLLAMADNFQRQYSFLFPERKPLLLCPINECGVKKFVSTTLRPTAPTHPELITWRGCASFVADFLSLDLLEPPVDLPRYLFSPTSVLQSRRATCFESATVLCSLLLGASYDAYCVSGYAAREMCVCDQSLQDCPLLDAEVKVEPSEQQPQANKYAVKPRAELGSRFLTQQEKKKAEAEAALMEEQESRQSPDDPLRGLRVHCWVLVLSGSRGVQESFFIDPVTGRSYSTAHGGFLGAESVWNNLNCYVNIRDCGGGGCADIVYDLDNVKLWEPVLFGAASKKQLTVNSLRRKEIQLMSRINKEMKEEEERPRVFEMPRSWVSRITVSKKDLESRWPGGEKVTRYRKAELERFSPDQRSDGLVSRLTTFKDLDCTEVATVKERYQHRSDHLEEREVNKVHNFTAERFKRGRPFHLIFHRFASTPAGGERRMEFSSDRVDGLVWRVESPGEMTEAFEGRADLLHHRHVTFDRRAGVSEPDVTPDRLDRPLLRVVEHFRRNRRKPASGDVAERVFLAAQRQIEVTYHLEDGRFIPAKRSFVKPRESTEQQKAEDFTRGMVSSFQVDPSEKALDTLSLYEMLVALIRDEEEVALQVKASLKEVRDVVASRDQEERDVQLHFSPWSTTGAARARSQRQEMERLAAEELRWLQAQQADVLAPLLIRLGRAGNLSADEARQLRGDCLAELERRLREEAQLIQERHDKETKELQKKQQWYQKNQLVMTEREEEEYQAYCSEKTLQIRVAKRRLRMHNETASEKYHGLDQRLRRDPRLAPHLLG